MSEALAYSYEDEGIAHPFLQVIPAGIEAVSENEGKRPFPGGEELYAQLVSPDLHAKVERQDNADPIIVEITADSCLRVNGMWLRMGERQRFFFNAALLLRDEPRSVSEYFDLGYRGEETGHRYFTASARGFYNRLNRLAGKTLISHQGPNVRNMKYHVDESLIVVDKRDEMDEYKKARKRLLYQSTKQSSPPKGNSEKLAPITKKITHKKLPLRSAEPFEYAEFQSLNQKQLACLEVVRKYKDHPRVNELLGAVYEEPSRVAQSSYRGELDDYKSSALNYRLLKPDEVERLFWRMEKGLAVWQQLDNRVPSAEEEADLIELAAAYQVIYSCNLSLVVKHVMKKLKRAHDPLITDLIQEGNIGLSESIGRFDHTKGFKFSTYANWWIRAKVDRGFTNIARPVRLPQPVEAQWKEYIGQEEQLRQELGREPKIIDIAEAIGLTALEVLKLREFGSRYLSSLDTPIDDERLLGDTIPYHDKHNLETELTFSKPSTQKLAQEILDHLKNSPSARLMLSLKYGIFVPALADRKFSYKNTVFTYEQLMQGLHDYGGELSNAEIAALLKIEEESVEEKIRETLKKVAAKYIYPQGSLTLTELDVARIEPSTDAEDSQGLDLDERAA